MNAPIFTVCKASSAVTDLLQGTDGILRLYPDEAPQGVQHPYAVYQIIGGNPENFLDQVPDCDSFSLQVDVYCNRFLTTQDAAEAIRDAIEPYAHITAWRGSMRDPTTSFFRFSFDVDWIVQR